MPGFPKNATNLLRLGSILKYTAGTASTTGENKTVGGLNNRLVVLTRDYLVYGTRLSSAAGFKIGGCLEVKGGHVNGGGNSQQIINNGDTFSFKDEHGKIILLATEVKEVS